MVQLNNLGWGQAYVCAWQEKGEGGLDEASRSELNLDES